jgi:phosphoserine phosphatase RsbU/P
MEIAQQIQTGLLPSKPPHIPGLDLAGLCLPATQVGGDYYDFFRHSDHELGLVIADVSGHDVGSAFIMATARSALRSEVLARKSPARILKDTNLVLYDDLTKTQKFITMFYAEYDGQARMLRYSNAAQNPPILLRDGTCTPLDTEGFFIGMWELGDFEEKTLQLVPNDFVILYTDGVVEAKNSAGHMFTVQRLTRVIEKAPPHVSAPELLRTIYNELERFTRQVQRTDDITVVVLKLQEEA